MDAKKSPPSGTALSFEQQTILDCRPLFIAVVDDALVTALVAHAREVAQTMPQAERREVERAIQRVRRAAGKSSRYEIN
jgi:hypothetical protein